jgi:hypothetical protein
MTLGNMRENGLRRLDVADRALIMDGALAL